VAAETIDPRVARTLRYSIGDGLGNSVMVGAAETFFIPYAIFIGASDVVLGLLVALPILLGSLSQIFSEKLLDLLGSRRRLICLSAALQAASFGPILLVPYAAGWESPLILASVCAYWIFGMVSGPSWSSLMGDLVEEECRGEYFGRRNRHMQIALFLSLAAGGAILWAFKRAGNEYGGYVTALTLAAAARLVSLGFLALHWDPPVASPPNPRTLSMVRQSLRHRDHRILILFLSAMSFGVYISAPYFSAYMLRGPERHGLSWSYATYTLIMGIALITKFLFLPLWGRASDRFGARKCLTLASWIVAGLPLLWLTPYDRPSLHFAMICTVQVLSGFSWAGYELCSFNFLLDSATAKDRPRLVASMNTVNGLMTFLGSLGGALVVWLLWKSGFQPYFAVFLLSSLARYVVCTILLGSLREVRQVESCSYRSLLFRITGMRANLGPVLRFFLLPARRLTGLDAGTDTTTTGRRPGAGP